MPDRLKTSKPAPHPGFAVDDRELALIDLAIAEDQGAGDWTTRWTVPARTRTTAAIVAKADGVIAGLGVATAVFLRLDPRVDIHTNHADGAQIASGDVVCTLKGSARSILTAERTALNFLQRLSGIATATRKYVDAIAGTNAVILDTRKTTPAWRTLERAAVRSGGASNHRAGLYDMVLIKSNHVVLAGDVAEAVRRVAGENNKGLRVAVEVRNKDELKAAVEAGCDRVLLDNMDVQAIREAVRIVRKLSESVEIEASGGITLDRVRAIAESGVDFISIGAITHSAPALDLSLRVRAG